MDAQKQGVLALIRCGLTGEKLPLPDGFDLERAYALLLQHQVLALGYMGALKCGISKRQPVMGKLFQNYCQYLQHSERQMALIQNICTAFDEVGVDYMPLKGCNLKALYPSPELRTMGDADILIRVGQYDTIKAALKVLGFSEVYESDHELIWEKDTLVLELHKRLIPSYNKDYYRYFGDGWQLAKPEQGTRYAMRREDEFVYLFTHFAKHYRDGGIGLRHLADLWVYLRAYPQLDLAYIQRELSSLKLAVFFTNVKKAIDAWMNDGQWDEVSRFVIDHVYASGAYGTYEGQRLSAVVREKEGAKSANVTRAARVRRLLFPSLERMAVKHPILKRAPILLPLFWLVRFVDVLLFKRREIGEFTRDVKVTGKLAVDTYQQELDFAGLHFNFEE